MARYNIVLAKTELKQPKKGENGSNVVAREFFGEPHEI